MTMFKGRLIDDAGRPIRLQEELGEGHHGAVHLADAEVAVKLPHKVDAEALEQRLEIPAESMYDVREQRNHWWVAWPLFPIYNADATDATVVGYALPYIPVRKDESGVSLAWALRPEDRVEAGLDVSFRWTLRAAMHVATAAWWAERRGLHALDLDPNNIGLDRASALATLLDPEGISVSGRLPEAHKDLRPPEQLQHGLSTPEAAGRWALAVTVLQILLQGAHPFNGVLVGGSGEHSPAANVQREWCSFLEPERGEAHWRINPNRLPEEVYSLARRCFLDGRSDPAARPSAEEWAQTLARVDALLVQCARKQRHWHQPGEECPWCEIERRTGQDPYPAPLS
jgi:DNA-binding helix-hairpin-helix protein with protein kinase domain